MAQGRESPREVNVMRYNNIRRCVCTSVEYIAGNIATDILCKRLIYDGNLISDRARNTRGPATQYFARSFPRIRTCGR